MLRQKQLPAKLPFAALTRGNDIRNRPRNTPNSLASNPQHAKKIILGLQFQNSMVYSLPNCWVILPGIIRNNHQNTDNHYEEDCYHRSYRRRFRVLPAAAAAAGDPRGCSSDRGSHQEVSDSRIGIPILLYIENAPIPPGWVHFCTLKPPILLL